MSYPFVRAPTHAETEEQAVRIQAAYVASALNPSVVKAMRNPTTEPYQRLAHPKREKRSAPVDERQRLREHILAMSLFPNLCNKAFLMRAQGSP